jgi:biotin carboxyl carrier protein
MMEAMKTQATVWAPCDGAVTELQVTVGETVEREGLLSKLRPVA